jgi:type IV secretion system protein VirB3
VSERNQGLAADPLFVGVTRPPMRWGVAYPALLLNMVATMELFLVTRNLLMLLVAVPVHGLCVLLCARDARFFDLLLVWAMTRLPSYLANARYWRAASYAPLECSLPDMHGRRHRGVFVVVDIGSALR